MQFAPEAPMKVLFSVFVSLLAISSVAHAKALPVTADQCQLVVNEPTFQYSKFYELQKRTSCLFGACNKEELGTQYLQLYVHPTEQVVYFTSIEPRVSEAGKSLDFQFERYTANYYDTDRDEKTNLVIRLVRDQQKPLWKAISTEKNRAGIEIAGSQTFVEEVDDSINFTYVMRGDVYIGVTCKLPY
jgi:hypothetical protein